MPPWEGVSRPHLQPLAYGLREDSFLAPCRELAASRPPSQRRKDTNGHDEQRFLPSRFRIGMVQFLRLRVAAWPSCVFWRQSPTRKTTSATKFSRKEAQKAQNQNCLLCLLSIFAAIPQSAIMDSARRDACHGERDGRAPQTDCRIRVFVMLICLSNRGGSPQSGRSAAWRRQRQPAIDRDSAWTKASAFVVRGSKEQNVPNFP